MANPPASVPVDGNTKVVLLTTAADTEAIKLTEANASSSTDISCYLTGDGWATTGDQGTITDSRLCTIQDFEQPGRETGVGLTIRYTFNLDVPADDEARLALEKGTTGVAVKRVQKPADEAFAVGDWYEAWPYTAGVQRVMAPEANAVDRIEQKLFITGPVVRFQQIVA
ncbi:hypothetical protein ACQ3HE_06660 [Plantibacter auratus]|uniref:phage tail tube protein n=1 Tax=Plantibacter auratus TaxID=272914 RepID=UPI003D3484F2